MDTLRIFTIVGVLLLASHPSGFTGVDGAAVPQNTTSTALPGEISFVVGKRGPKCDLVVGSLFIVNA